MVLTYLLSGPTRSLNLTAGKLLQGCCSRPLLLAFSSLAYFTISALAELGHWQHSQYCSIQKSLDLLLTLLTQPALDHSMVVQHYVFVHTDGVEALPSNASHPDHLWVAYVGTLVYIISFVMLGKHALNWLVIRCSMPCLV